jgi:S-adenosylmethionine:tRNA ribosyltransferase-isomerase
MPDLIDGEQFLSTYGQMPLPPYIRRSIQERDKSDYQTTYATEAGSVAAPTAGLHFTPEIIDSLKARGTQVLNVTLHVGWGTFAPVLTRELKDHPMHREQFWIPEETAECLNKAKEQKRRITAVGTTTVRSLESAGRQGLMQSGSFDTNLLISPPHTFRFVDRLLTNFHQPGTTLLALVAAFVDPHPWRDLYEEGIKQEYRLFSYGDAMLIL